ncbi:MAG TPA: GxxExxY protein [Candidatus Thermoplasmatota archaeon]|nr:GxxExxY protein [Candidatus Thermoplasmatota archaeon]
MDPGFPTLSVSGVPAETNEISGKIIHAALALHREIGPGLLEKVYRIWLAEDLREAGLEVAEEVYAPLVRKGRRIDDAYRLDLLVGGRVIVEVKTVQEVLPVHLAQLRTYLKLTGCQVGLLLNFTSPRLKDGIHRLVWTAS